MKAKLTEEFIQFLKTINLEYYRKKYIGNKSVEEDLPPNIQILNFIYKKYWEERNFISFEKFISWVIDQIENDLIAYNNKRNNFSEYAHSAYPAFKEGWIARQYRTWTSILTQIQFGYICEQFYPDKKIIINAELDRQGVDVRVVGIYDYGVKKVSNRKDIIKIKRQESKGVIPITYWVPPQGIIKNPKKKNGEFRKPYLDFKNDQRLDILSNGFIIFNKKVFDELGK
jgi:hypothetical protein